MNAFDLKLLAFKRLLLSWTDPTVWAIDKSAESILDIGCGQGKVMDMIKKRVKVKKSVGVDTFKPYIKEARANKIHSKYIIGDARKVSFKPNSFDVVLISQVLEHMPKKDAWKLLKKCEKIAKKQILISAPIGDTPQDAIDGNEMQKHLCFFEPEEFKSKGYTTINYGWSWLLGHEGIIENTSSELLKKILYTFNLLLTPIYYLFPNLCDYSFVAYRNLQND